MSDIVYRIRELDPDIIAPSTKRMNVSEQGGSKIVFIGKPGCFERGTKILMYDGMLKNVEDVRVGDKVMGDDSSPRNVLELCHNFDEMFKMNPVRGESYVVNKQHILTLKNEQDHIIDITVEKFLEKDRAFRERYKWFRTAVEFPAQPLEKDPYTVGAWLGGGNPTSGHIEGEILDYNFLRKNNLLFNKHIPQHYKVNSRSNRLKLLAGILDTSNSSFVL